MSVELEQRSERAAGFSGTNKPMAALGYLRLLLLGMWIGAAVLFSFVVAPAAFGVLPSREWAGALVSRVLGIVNTGGFFIGVLLLMSVSIAKRFAGKRALLIEVFALLVFVVSTGVGQWVIAARLQALRFAMGRPVDLVAADDPLRIAFNNLHGYSVTALGIAMIAALTAFFFIARRGRN